jgi:RHS repeat-associated protein
MTPSTFRPAALLFAASLLTGTFVPTARANGDPVPNSNAPPAAQGSDGSQTIAQASTGPREDCLGNLPPTVAITSPANNATSPAPASFAITATATDSDGVVGSVQFFVDNVLLAVDSTSPYNATATGLAPGTHTLKASATDDCLLISSATVSVSSVNHAPTVTLTSPSNGASAVAPATFSLTATASDSDGTIANVQFKSGSSVVFTDTTAPYSYSYSTSVAGTYVISAVATDNTGATATSSSATVTVSAAANTPPTVSLTAPANGASQPAGGVFNIAASASDPGGSVASVKFLANGVLIGSDTTSPYTFAYTPSAPGSVALTAIATDNVGASTTSTARNVTVTAAPTVSEVRSFVYDQYHRVCKTINPESGATVVDYDGAGNIAWTAEGLNLPSTTSCDRTGVTAAQKTVRSYDPMNRVKAVSTPGGAADVLTDYYADGKVQRLTAANPGGYNVVSDYAYNKRRLLTGETQTNGSAVYTLGYAYDANGFLASLTYPDTQVVNYSPDALGRTTAVASTGQIYANTIGYYPNGAISGFRYGGLAAVTHAMTQNTRKLPMRSVDAKTGTGAWTILDDTYDYDANGNVLDIIDQAQGGATTRGMAYDGLDRLTAATGIWGVAGYTYDALDNLRSADQGSRQYRYNYNPTTWRLDSIKDPAGSQIFAFGYDAQGNTASKNSQLFTFDSANRMSTAGVTSGSGVQTYRYDGMGRRVETTDPDGKTTFWVYSQTGQVLYSSEARRSRNISYIYLGNSQIATRTVAWAPLNTVAVRFQFTDALGSPVADANSTVGSASVNRTNYAPYGEALAPAVVDGTGYTGHVMDVGTGLTYMQQRYYDPVVARFASVDPISPASGGEFSRYRYAAGNPYRNVDADGRQAVVPEAIEVEIPEGETTSRSPDEDSLQRDLRIMNPPLEPTRPETFVESTFRDPRCEGPKADPEVLRPRRTYQTYFKDPINPETHGRYNGRTSGTGTPARNVARRDGGHHMSETHGPARLDRSSTNPGAIRGREQQNIEASGGAQSSGGTSGNAINGVSPSNPNAQTYADLAKLFFGE